MLLCAAARKHDTYERWHFIHVLNFSPYPSVNLEKTSIPKHRSEMNNLRANYSLLSSSLKARWKGVLRFGRGHCTANHVKYKIYIYIIYKYKARRSGGKKCAVSSGPISCLTRHTDLLTSGEKMWCSACGFLILSPFASASSPLCFPRSLLFYTPLFPPLLSLSLLPPAGGRSVTRGFA